MSAMTNEVILKVENLYKLYGSNKQAARRLLQQGAGKDEILKLTGVTVAVNNVSFSVKRGEIYVLIGLSGSGKSTVVRCLNMLNRPTAGKILLEGNEIETFSKQELLDMRRKKISMVFQSFGLMSHRNVLSNVAYGPEVRGVKKAEREQKALEMIAMVGLEGWEHNSIQSLSGGMRQRVGLARALANDPDVLLMDEPFSALDPLVRRDMQFELLTIQKKLNKTIVFITHDINEAFKLGNTVSIMKDGAIIQTATPEEMTTNPADEYVRDFIDSADKSQIFFVKHIMQTPDCLIHSRDGVLSALKQMKRHSLSSAYVVDDNMAFVGVLPLEQALRVKEKELSFAEAIIRNIPSTSPETQIADVLPIAAEARFPIPVVDENKRFCGIVSKAAVIGSLT